MPLKSLRRSDLSVAADNPTPSDNLTSGLAPNYPTQLTKRRGRPTLAAMTALGKIIQKRRNEKGITLAALMTLTGLPPQTVNAIERGESRQPRFDTLYKLSVALELPINELADAVAKEALPA